MTLYLQAATVNIKIHLQKILNYSSRFTVDYGGYSLQMSGNNKPRAVHLLAQFLENTD